MNKSSCLRGSCFAKLLLLPTLLLLAACNSNEILPGKVALVNANSILMRSPSGVADLNWNPASHDLIVKLTLFGLAPKKSHPAHIYRGDCKNIGKVEHSLKDIVADETGSAMVTSIIKKITAGIPKQGWSINISSVQNTKASAHPLACVEITNPESSTKVVQHVQAPLMIAPSPMQSAHGVAQFALSDHTLMVKLAVNGLTPNAAHIARVHVGSCAHLGKILYTLNPIRVDAVGKGHSITTITGVTSIPVNSWYVNVLSGMNSDGQIDNDPLLCGNVTFSR